MRLDHRLSDKDTLFGSLSWSEQDKLNTPPFPGALDGAGFAGAVETNKGRNAQISYTRVWSPSIISETRLGFTRLVTARTQANADQDFFREFNIGGRNPFAVVGLNGGLPTLNPDGYSGFGGSEWLPTQQISNVWNLIQNVAINKGGHAFKFGFEGRDVRFPNFQVPSARGTFQFNRNRTENPQFPGVTGDGVASMLLGLAGGGTRVTTANGVSSLRKVYAGYFQDDWKVSQKLTFNLGVRYELVSPIGERFGRQSSLDYMGSGRPILVIPRGNNQDAPLPPNFPVAQVEVQRGQVDQYIIGWDKSNIAPRFGMAYQFMNKTVLRAGYGIFYGGEEAQGGDPNRGQNIPFNQEVQLQPPDAFAPNPFIGRLSDGIPANIFTQNAPIRFRTVARNFRNPLVHKWNLSLQRELGWGTVLDVSYIGSAGRRLLVLWNPNQPLNVADPAAPTRPRRRLGAIADTNFSTADTFGFSNYHALATQLTKRYSNGLDFQIAYTWGNALTNVGTPLAGGPGVRDVTNLSAEYAAANFDIRHRFVYSGTYELPFGKGKALFSDAPKFAQAVLGNWQANAVLTLQTGFARSVGTQNARCGCGGTVRPDYVPGVDPNDVSGGRTPDRWFNTAAFQNPAPGTFGNVGHFTLRAPGITNLDFSLFKTFPISERINLQFRAESFNLTNTPQFNPESLNLTQGNSRFGTLNGTNPGTTRNFQFALRLQF